MKKLLALLTVITMAFTGCSIKKDNKAAGEMPPDKPWNRIIMETESGFYYQSNWAKMSLRYSERANGTNIFLCAKPECQHNGETSCTATYPFTKISNYVLYNDCIYFAANVCDEDVYDWSLYKSALDGSSLDKVSEIRHSKNNSDSVIWCDFTDICIHKGYAYVPYDLGETSSFTDDFIETGFARVNILTGESEILFSHDEFLGCSYYSVVCGIGDYVYYIRKKNSKNILCRYNIKNGASDEFTGELGKILADPFGRSALDAVTENTVYVHYYNNETLQETLTAYDLNTSKKTDFELDLQDEYTSGYHKTMFYDNKIFVARLDRIDVYSDTGVLLGSHPVPSYFRKDEAIAANNNRSSRDFREFDISNDKIYMEYKSESQILDAEYYDGWDRGDSMYSCSIEDVIAGKGNWEKQYELQVFDFLP